MSFGSLARRYAQALLELAREQASLATSLQELQAFTTMVQEHHELRELMSSQELETEKKVRVITELASQLKLSTLVTHFLLVLAHQDRLAALADIAREFTRLVDRDLEQARATLVTASAIPPPVGGGIRRALEAKTGQKILLKEEIDPSILGGLLLKLEGRLWDASVKGQLQKIKEQMLA